MRAYARADITHEDGEMDEWVSVGNKLPEEGQYVAFASFYSWSGKPEYDSVVAGRFSNGRFYPDTEGLDASNYDGGACITLEMKPSHWVALPSPPVLS